ncbi:hypothetical protein IQ266_19985 [filamentous cyanobacterium LEGE 11480]|uniref:Uncharacterized protein n=1 Tax=Romeriopsis navalis LEGE 11480 TaxID=2777977 RepID=A0A928VS77_9CYAN|nr:hypothetical protein [Romeriopsis navalis]MBE9032021.1 hypothetical protein [Romeriopsis navalis LEGE 11480]
MTPTPASLPQTPDLRQSRRSLIPRSLRQFRLKSLKSLFWWLRVLHPWSSFGLIAMWWVIDRDRRIEHQVRLQRLFFDRVNFRDIEISMSDFIRPELWLL